MSAVLEREVSEGYPVEGKIFEPPQRSKDNEEPHYVTILGSTVEPDTARERRWTKFGGIEIANPCLNYVQHFIMKGRLTPILKDKHEWVTADYWERATGKDTSYFERTIPVGYQAPTNETGRPSNFPRMMAKYAFPGDQMESILNGAANVFKRARRGVVELKTLKGQPYNPVPLGDGIVSDASIWAIQKAIFPSYPFLPTLLDETESLLIAAQVHTSLRSIVDEMLESLSQFRDYARSTVEQTHYTMRESAQKSEAGYIPRYSGLDFVLLEQLGLGRQDINIRQEAKSPSGEMTEIFKQFLESQAAYLKAQTSLTVDEIGKIATAGRLSVDPAAQPAVDGTTMMAAPPTEFDNRGSDSPIEDAISDQVLTNATPESQEQMNVAMADTQPEFVCVCGKEAVSLAGLKAHERACGKAKGEQNVD